MVSINLKADKIQFEFDVRQFSRHFDWTWGSSMKFWETGLHNFQYHVLHETPKKVEEIRYFCNNSFDVGRIYGVAEWQSGNSRFFIRRQFPLYLEAIPIKLPPIVKVTCFCAEREIWGWRKIWKNAQREFLGMEWSFFRTDCYWPVSKCRPPPPLRLFFSHWQGWGWIEKRQFFGDSTSAEIVLHKTDRESQKIFLTVSFYLAGQRLLGRPCPSPHSPTWSHGHCEAQRAELGPTQKAKEFTDSTSTSQSLCNWSHGFSGSSSGAKLHYRDVTMKLKLSSTQPTFCLSPLSPPPSLLWRPSSSSSSNWEVEASSGKRR